MSYHKINITFDIITMQKLSVSSVIKRCITETLHAENVSIPCEINVLVTNDNGIHAINKASRNIDSPTDILSFPMFQLEPGNPPLCRDRGEGGGTDPGTVSGCPDPDAAANHGSE